MLNNLPIFRNLNKDKKKSKFSSIKIFLVILPFLFFFFSVHKSIIRNLNGGGFVFAASALRNFNEEGNIEELKSKIEDKNQEMEKIKKEIEEYENKLNTTSKESSNLKGQIKILENNLSKIKSEIKFSQNRIKAAKLSLQQLSLNIGQTENNIQKNQTEISETLRLMNDADHSSLLEILLANNNLSDFFDNLNSIEKTEEKITVNLNELMELKEVLEKEKGDVHAEKTNLETRRSELLDREEIQKYIQNQKSEILKQTQSKEQVYKKIIENRIKKQRELENEISKIEQEIKIVIDPNSLPKSEKGVLAWPLNQNLITQYFGNTPFATKNSQLYGGVGHNGIDLRATVGTEVMASADGIVTGTGNTDAACKGVSYGKWILIKHNNNLSTLYAHLSLIKVKEGDIIEQGQTVAYTGDTGYITGPHLHFTVFASKAVKVSTLQSKVCGTIMHLPIASYNGYLNPLSYL